MKKFALALLAVTIVTPQIFAQHGRGGGYYRERRGPEFDVRYYDREPGYRRDEWCDRYRRVNNVEIYRACDNGADHARRMAEIYAGQNGRIDGYQRGYSWGLRYGVNEEKSDSAQISYGRQSVSGLGHYMTPGITRGSNEGVSRGNSNGNSDAIGRFTSIIDKGVEPDPAVRIPGVSYEPNHYAYNEFVGATPTAKSIMINEVREDNYFPYRDLDVVSWGVRVQPNWIDFWIDDGTYGYERNRWVSYDNGYGQWKRRNSRMYDNLGSVSVDTGNTKPVLNADGTPKLDASGNPVTEKIYKTYDLKEIFDQAYRVSYDTFADYYYSREFHRTIDDGMRSGELIGRKIGLRLAYYQGQEQEFNSQFIRRATEAFHESFRGSYSQSFNETFREYSTTPQLAVSLNEVIGLTDDGILRPNEPVSLGLTVRNYGGVGSNLNVGVGGDLVGFNGDKAAGLSVNRLSSKTYGLENVARVNPALSNADKARFAITVNGVSDTLSKVVNYSTQLVDSSDSTMFQEGHGTVIVRLQNISRARTPELVTVKLNIAGKEVVQNAGFINSGETVTINLSFADVNPIALFGGVSGLVQVLEGEQLVARGNVKITPSTKIKTIDLASYYVNLLNGRAFIPSGVKSEDQLASANLLIREALRAEILEIHRRQENNEFDKKNPIPYKTANLTLLGNIVLLKEKSKPTSAAQAELDKLAVNLYDKDTRKLMSHGLGGLFKESNREIYEKLVKQLSSNPKSLK